MKLLSSLVICFPLYVQGEDRRTGGYRETKSYRQYRPAQNYCDHKQPCSLSSPGQPVCNFDFGDHGFCEECPGHCLKTGYNNEIMAVPICCDVCRYGEQEGCGDNVRRPQMTAGVAQYRPSTFQKFLNQASRNIKWGTRKAVKAYQGTELSNEVNQAVAGIVDPKVKKLQDAQKELFEIKNSDKSPEEKVNEVKQVLQSVGINAPFDLEDVKKDVGRKLSRKTGLGKYEREQVKSVLEGTGKDARDKALGRGISEAKSLLKSTGIINEKTAGEVMDSLQKAAESAIDRAVGPAQEQKISAVVSQVAESWFKAMKRRVGLSSHPAQTVQVTEDKKYHQKKY